MNLVQVFSTPMWESPFPEFDKNKEVFLKAVKDFREKNPESAKKSNIGGGYQSPMNLTTESEMSPLFDFVCQMGLKAAFDINLVDVDVYLTAAWVNFNDTRSSSNHEHVHSDTFSGVFYLQVPENSGKLSFNNPGLNPLWQGLLLTKTKNKFTSERIKIEPTEGTVLIWPSYMSHSVLPNDHDDSRISISFNIICIPKEHVEHTR